MRLPWLSVIAVTACGMPPAFEPSERQESQGSLVILDEKAPREKALSLAAGIAGAHRFEHLFSGVTGHLSATERAALLRSPLVRAIYPLGKRHLHTLQENATWGLDRLDQEALPLDARYRFRWSGDGVTAYVVDTGVQASHPEFEGRALAAVDLSSDRGTVWEGKDGHGHGTHVSGTLASRTFGVAKSARIVGVKVFDHTGGEVSDADVLAGLEWVVAHHAAHPGPAVLNLSMGGEPSEAIDLAVRRATEAGIVVAVSAGNENADACQSSPAREPSAITTAALAQDGGKPSFSNWGSCVDLIAPGAAILSTWVTPKPRALYGTSMASPHVAGLAALVLSAFPQMTPQEVRDFLVSNATLDQARGFPEGTPNRIASGRWNLPESPADEPWQGTFEGRFSAEETLLFPGPQGFLARAGTTLRARLENGGHWAGANADLVLSEIREDGSRREVAASTSPGMDDTLDFVNPAPARLVVELRGVTGGLFKLRAESF